MSHAPDAEQLSAPPLAVAFYGTLLQGLPARPGRPAFEPLGRYGAQCLIRGELYDAGAHPCLRPGEGVVRGQLWQPFADDAFSLLDAWEEYDPADPAGSPFVRQAWWLHEPRLRAYVYVYNRHPDGMPLIDSGDWRTLATARDGRPLDGGPGTRFQSPRPGP